MSGEGLRDDLVVCRFPSSWEGNLRHAVIDNIVLNPSRTHILLVWRGDKEIEGNKWALVGGYVDPDATVQSTVEAETGQETNQKQIGAVALFRVVDNPNRRNETAQNISFVFVSEVPDPPVYGEITVTDPDQGVTKARWFPLDALPAEEEMAFDHHRIVTQFLVDPTSVYDPTLIFMSS